MRIVLWSNFRPAIGGMEVWAAALSQALHAAGHRVVVIASQPLDTPAASRERFGGVDIHFLPLAHALAARDPGAMLGARRRILDIYRGFSPDVVHYNFNGREEFFFLETARRSGLPALLSVHGFWPGQERRADSMLHRALRAADWITAVSDAVLQRLRRLAPGITRRSSRIHPAVRDACADARAPGFRPPVLLYAGRIAREKGADLVVPAFARVARALPAARLVVAGDGPDRAAMAAQAAQYGLGDAVAFRGWVPPADMPAAMQAASLVLVPSRTEGFGLSALEAALCGRPVVAADTGGLPEIVVDGATGVLVSPGDAAALAGGILALVNQPARAVAMGRAARERAVRRFSVDAQTRAFEAIYARLSAGGAGA